MDSCLQITSFGAKVRKIGIPLQTLVFYVKVQHILTTSLLCPKTFKAIRMWYGLVGRGKKVVRTQRDLGDLGQILNMLKRNVTRTGWK